MDETTEELAARLAAVEAMLAHLLAETMLKDPNGTVAGLIRQSVNKRPEAIAKVKPDTSVIEAHLDPLLLTAAHMAKKLSTGR